MNSIIFLRILIFAIIVYAMTALFAYFFADSQIFFPPKSSYQDSREIIKIPSKNGLLISAIYLPNPKAKYTVLVSHGNAEDLGSMLPFLNSFRSQGYAVFAYDYQGYGTSQGKPSEKNTYADEMAAYTYLTQELKISPHNIIAYGHSLGTALALDLASQKHIAGLILESPFTSIFRVAFPVRILFFDKYNNMAKIKKISCPILIIHGTKDEVIPFAHGEKLYKEALPPKMFYSVAGGGHNNLQQTAGPEFWNIIKKFSYSLP